ncbi:MAG: cobaltochelatase subunit CobT [Sphingomonadales bacterium]
MNPYQQRKSDDFKRAVRAATRAIAECPELEVSFGFEEAAEKGVSLQLLEPAAGLSASYIAATRGRADAFALMERFHNDRVHKSSAPKSPSALGAFNAIEEARVEALGASIMAGVAKNLAVLQVERCRKAGLGKAREKEDVSLAAALGLLVRERLTGRKPPGLARTGLGLVRDWIETRAGESLDGLCACMDDQAAFSELTRQILRDLDLMQEGDERQEEEAGEGEDSASGQEENDADANAEGPDGEGAEQQEAAQEDAGDESQDLQTIDVELGDEGEANQNDDGAETTLSWRPNMPLADPLQTPFYTIYTAEFDEQVGADTLAEEEELARLRLQLDRQLSNLHSVAARLANRLQRLLMAKQNRSWVFDLEEGILDAAKLTRVVTNPVHPLSFKQESEITFRDTVVSLLIDNSGSMRGRPISIAAVSTDLLARTLERCGVKVEILGFTTKAWKGGQSREKWLADGKPAKPGRLNDLRHIIYKTADMPWRRARRNLGLMLKEGLLKENIDGEALMWAHNRLIGRHEERRILMVISDGAPVDDSTLSSNTPTYLEDHLCQVISWIEARSPVQLLAIGIGHDVNRYYDRAVTIVDAEELAGTMIEQLAELFDESGFGNTRRLGRSPRVA